MILGCAAMLIVVGFGLVFFGSVFKLILSFNSADLLYVRFRVRVSKGAKTEWDACD